MTRDGQTKLPALFVFSLFRLVMEIVRGKTDLNSRFGSLWLVGQPSPTLVKGCQRPRRSQKWYWGRAGRTTGIIDRAIRAQTDRIHDLGPFENTFWRVAGTNRFPNECSGNIRQPIPTVLAPASSSPRSREVPNSTKLGPVHTTQAAASEV